MSELNINKNFANNLYNELQLIHVDKVAKLIECKLEKIETMRRNLASTILNGLLCSPHCASTQDSEKIERAIKMADALIAELAKGEAP